LAEHGEIPAAWAGLAAAGTFFGGVLAAVFGRKTPEPKGPEKAEASMGAWMQQVNEKLADHGARLERAETDRKEDREDFGLVFKKLDDLSRSNGRIEGALGIGGTGDKGL